MVRFTLKILLLVMLTVLFLPGTVWAETKSSLQYKQVESLQEILDNLMANKENKFRGTWVHRGKAKELNQLLELLTPYKASDPKEGIRVLYIPENNNSSPSNLLLLVEVVGPGEEGIYTSPSTKRPGLITLKDLELEVDEANHLSVTPEASTLLVLQKSKQQMEKIYEERFWVLGALGLIGLVLVTFSFIIREPSKTLPIALLTFLLSPALILLMDQAWNFHWYERLILVFVFGGIMAYILWEQEGRGVLAAGATVGFINLGVFAFDALMGSPMLKGSLLGPDPLIGARFFGFGNEAAAILIFSTLLATNGLQWWKGDRGYVLTLFLLGIPCLLFLHPTWGANMGASLTALIVLFLAPFFFGGRKLSLLRLFIIGLTAIALVVLAGLLDLWTDGTPSWHLTALLKEGDLGGAWQILVRKLEMVKAIFSATPFTWAALGFYVVYTISLFKKPGLVSQLTIGDFPFYQWQKLFTIGGWVMFFTNDSGFIALIIMFVLNLVFLALWHHQARRHFVLTEGRGYPWNM